MQVVLRYRGDNPDGKRIAKGLNSLLKKLLKSGWTGVFTVGEYLRVSTDDGLLITLDRNLWEVETLE